MNLDLRAYSPLESLLLFQSLATHGVDTPAFSRISDLLKKNPHINSHERFESGRLSPESLQSFYLRLLKEELKNDRQNGTSDAEGQNGEVRNSRKRKAPSPPLPTVQEAAQHASLIPKLIARLYATYRKTITNQIREDEQRYERLQRELQEIERGEWDNHLKEKAKEKSPISRSPSLPRKSPLLPQKQLPQSPQTGAQDGPRVGTPLANSLPLDGVHLPTGEAQKSLVPPNGQVHDERNAKGAPNTSPRKRQAVPDQPGTPATPQTIPGPSPSPQQSRTPQVVIPTPLRFQPSQAINTPYNGPPPHTHRSPYPPPGPQPNIQVPQAVPGSHGPNQIPTPHTISQSPSVNTSSASPFQPPPIQPYGANGVPQHGPTGAPPHFSPSQQRLPGPYSHGPQSPNVQTPQQQRNVYTATPGQPVYPPPPHQSQVNQPPPQSGFMLPPFQVSPQDPSRAHPQPIPPHQPQYSTPVANRQGYPTAQSGPATASSMRQGLPPIYAPANQGRPSFGTPLGVRTPQSGIQTPRSAKTLWKPSIKSVATPPAPRPEVSPIDDMEPLVPPKQSPPKAKSTRASRAKGKKKDKELEPEEEEAIPEIEIRQGRSRRKAPTRRGRPGSIASSRTGGSVRERSRSQSIISHTETIAADSESQVGNRVKSERGISVDVIEEDPAGTPSLPSTRGRRAAGRTTGKRKRENREASVAESDDRHETPGLPRTVIAQRQFSKTSAGLIEGVESHKHASIFNDKVKAKDAEGYYDLIKRPTSIKEIKKAINTGVKAVAAAVSDTPAASPGGSGGFLELPLTADLVPPKAIVNSGQLEKELMRMFVNAVMFNPGEEGVVEDAREMSETVHQQVSIWRNINQGNRHEIEETPPVPTPAEEEAPPASKRRKP